MQRLVETVTTICPEGQLQSANRGAILSQQCGVTVHHPDATPNPAPPFPTQIHPTGACMNLSISHKHADLNVEADTTRAVEKLNRLLKTYDPDLVLLHGVFSQSQHTQDHTFSLNLSLPTGTIHATATAENVRACCKKAFAELESQVKKHQSRLRHDHEWKRKHHGAPSSIRTADAES